VAGDGSEFVSSASRRSCHGNLDKYRITAQRFRQSGTKEASVNHSVGCTCECGHSASKCDDTRTNCCLEQDLCVFYLWDTDLHDEIYRLERSNASAHGRFVRVRTSR
jgi:hypothetical protein